MTWALRPHGVRTRGNKVPSFSTEEGGLPCMMMQCLAVVPATLTAVSASAFFPATSKQLRRFWAPSRVVVRAKKMPSFPASALVSSSSDTPAQRGCSWDLFLRPHQPRHGTNGRNAGQRQSVGLPLLRLCLFARCRPIGCKAWGTGFRSTAHRPLGQLLHSLAA